VQWREVARGTTLRAAHDDSPAAVVVATPARSRAVAKRLPAGGRASLARVDLARSVVVAIFGNFGCSDRRVAVRSIAPRAGVLHVVLVTRPLRPDEMECQAIFGTYRLLAVPRTQLGTPPPARAVVERA
jgi:hypothetical protein